MNARESAFLSLQKHENSGAYSNIELAYAIERGGLEGAEKALYTALFYGVIERKLTLDYYISLLSDRKEIDPNVRIILRLGLYQLIYMTKIPESAAVNESVKLARRFYARKNSENFINAVLRNFLRKRNTLRLPDEKRNPSAVFPWNTPFPNGSAVFGSNPTARKRPSKFCRRSTTVLL